MVGVRVSSHEKKKFEEFLETEEGQRHNSVADMMRTTAHDEVNNAGESDLDSEEIINAMEIALSDVTEELDSLNTQMTVIKDSIGSSDDIQTFAAELYDHLPSSPDDSILLKPARDDDVEWLPDEHEDNRPRITTLEEARQWSDKRAWADYFDEPVEKVQRALALCVTQYPDVEVSEEVSNENPIRQYYRPK